MIRVLGACRPTRVDERVMEKLLDVVDDTLFEIAWVIREHPNARNRLLDRPFMAPTNGRLEIPGEQASYTLCVR